MVSLAKEAKDITLSDIFDAVEKEEELFHFHESPNPDCPVGKNVHAVLDNRLFDIQEAMRKQMNFMDIEMPPMEGNTVLHQLMSVRIESVMNEITENDAFYQKTKQRAEEYSDKLDALKLPKEAKLLLGGPHFKK